MYYLTTPFNHSLFISREKKLDITVSVNRYVLINTTQRVLDKLQVFIHLYIW